MMYRTRRLPWRNSFPRSGSCCVSNNPRGFLYLSAGYCCHWQDWPTCKVSSSKKKKKKKALTGLSQAVTRAGASMKRVLKLEKGKATRCAAAVEVYVRGMKSQLSKKAFQAMCSGSSRWPMTLA